MDYQERKDRLETYGAAYVELTETLKQFPPEMWQWQAPESWSIHEVILHLADAETHGYIRCRRLIAEPGSAVVAYDEQRWASALDYHERSVADALELFRWLRLTTYKLLKSLPEGIWSQTIEHPEHGTMTLDNWLASYTNHVSGHLEQLGAIHEQWQQSQRG